MICSYCGRPVCGFIEDHKCDKGVNVDKIKEAKDFLRTVLGINYNRYIYTKLAGDFAVEVSKELHNLSSQLEEVTRQRDEAISMLNQILTIHGRDGFSLHHIALERVTVFLQSITAESKS